MIRKATVQDIDAIKRIADANKDTLGFVMRPALQEALVKHWLLIAELDGKMAGFVNYRHRRDGQTTIYEICVSQQYRGQGIGSALMDALAVEVRGLRKSYIQLKAIVGIPANHFYEQYGFTLMRVEPGRKQALNVWRFGVGASPLPLQPLVVNRGLGKV